MEKREIWVFLISKKLNVIIIGCGLIGNKRAKFLNNKFSKLVYCCDIKEKKAIQFAKKYKCTYVKNYKKVDLSKIDVAFICTTHNFLFSISKFFLKKNKHVFVEKPGSLNLKQILDIKKVLNNNNNIKYAVGFNHRFHPAFQKVFEIIKKNLLGNIMFIRGQYGHGGRKGYDKEWRAKFKLSGGGELIDQGTHLIDLSRCLLGEFKKIQADLKTYFWKMKVEDNCFLTLTNKHGNIAFLQASCTEWKNTFNFEIYGKKGKLQIEGLGGSYGTEKLKFFSMSKKMGPPKTYIYKYLKKDRSWLFEQNEFFRSIFNNTKIKNAGINDAVECHKIISKIYKK